MPSGGEPTVLGDKCLECGEHLTEENYVRNGPFYIKRWCQPCWRLRAKDYQSRTKKARAANWIEWKYGLSREEYTEKFTEQDGKCEICEIPFGVGKLKPHVDHNHETGEIRGLLCQNCNLALGLIKERRSTLIAMLSYLMKYDNGI